MTLDRLSHQIAAILLAVVVGALLGAGARVLVHDGDPVGGVVATSAGPADPPSPRRAPPAPPSSPTRTSTTTPSPTSATVPPPPTPRHPSGNWPNSSAPPPTAVPAVPTTLAQGAVAVDHHDVASVTDWVREFEAAHAAGDLEHLLVTLHPVVAQRFGAARCEDYVESTMGSVREIEVLAVGDPAGFEFPPGAGNSLATVLVTARWTEVPTGRTALVEFHLVPTADGYAWLTRCGVQLPSAT